MWADLPVHGGGGASGPARYGFQDQRFDLRGTRAERMVGLKRSEVGPV